MNRLLKMNTYGKGEVTAYKCEHDDLLPIELCISFYGESKQTWLTPEQALNLAEFLVLAIEQLNKEKTNGSELQET